ncbi:MAG: TraR/DksA C4-type zinc finger protein [Coriobacteriales bacterium]|nr:TraR/DksA C4-type zinc finger protein [Coriobacteriales bacterium]
MNKRMQSALRERLEAELERLVNEVAELDREERDSLSEASGENTYRDHMADLGSATFERDMDMALEENVRRQLNEVQTALSRIDKGDYGVCEVCHSEIPVERLEAMPTAVLCRACKEAEEAH